MPKVQTTTNIFNDVLLAIQILQKHNINFDLEKDNGTFILKTTVSESLTLNFVVTDKSELKQIYNDFFIFTDLYNFTVETDLTTDNLTIQFLV